MGAEEISKMSGSMFPRRHSRNRLSRSLRSWRSASLIVTPPLLLAAPALAQIPTPTIPNTTFLVTTYGAVGNGSTNDTTDIQSAINAAAAAGGGIVEIPDSGTGVFESGQLTMANNVDLQVQSGAELQALTSIDSTSGAFITCSGVSNFEITGTGSGATEGDIDGHATAASNLNMITLSGVQTALIQGVQITNSPHEHINTGSSVDNDITVNDVTINTPSGLANTDGIDPAGTNWLIENCTINDGDDDIAVKPLNQFCNNITINNITVGYGHGISIGGQTNAGFNNLTVNDITFTNTQNGFRLKSGRLNGGLVQNLVYNNVTMTNVANPIFISSWYLNGGDHYPTPGPANAVNIGTNSLTPYWHNISFNNITSTDLVDSDGNAGLIYGLPEAPIQGLTLNNVNLTALNPMQINFAGYNGAFGTTPNPAYEVLMENSTIDGLAPNLANATQFDQPGSVTPGLFDTVIVIPVPEPASLSLMAVAPLILLRRRNRAAETAATLKVD
jgi:polygalacturonase